jgi:hypothetical protein
MFITRITYSTLETPPDGIFIEFTFFQQVQKLRLAHIEEIEFVRQQVHAAYAQQQGISPQTFYDTWMFTNATHSISISITDGQPHGVLVYKTGAMENRIKLDLQQNFKSILTDTYNALQEVFNVEMHDDDDKENEF